MLRRNLLSLTALLCAASIAGAQSESNDVDWPTYMGNWDGSKYKPLDQINASNFNNLEIVWRFKTDHIGNRPEFKLEGTPLEVGGVVYATAGSRRGIIALAALVLANVVAAIPGRIAARTPTALVLRAE